MAIEVGALNRHDHMFLTRRSSVTTFGLKNKKNPFLVDCNCHCSPPPSEVMLLLYREDKLACTQQVSGEEDKLMCTQQSDNAMLSEIV